MSRGLRVKPNHVSKRRGSLTESEVIQPGVIDRPVPPLWAPVLASVLVAAIFLASSDWLQVTRPSLATLFLGTSWIPTALFAARAITGANPIRWLPAIISLMVFGYLWLWLWQA